MEQSHDVPSLLQITLRKLIEWREYIGDIGEMPFDQIRPALDACTAQQLHHIEEATLEGGRNLKWDTWPVWRNLCIADFGQGLTQRQEVPKLEPHPWRKDIGPLEDGTPPGDWQQVYVNLLQKRASLAERMRSTWQSEQQSREGRQIALAEPPPDPKRKRRSAAPSQGPSGSRPAAASPSQSLSARGSILKKLGMLKKERGDKGPPIITISALKTLKRGGPVRVIPRPRPPLATARGSTSGQGVRGVAGGVSAAARQNAGGGKAGSASSQEGAKGLAARQAAAAKLLASKPAAKEGTPKKPPATREELARQAFLAASRKPPVSPATKSPATAAPPAVAPPTGSAKQKSSSSAASASARRPTQYLNVGSGRVPKGPPLHTLARSPASATDRPTPTTGTPPPKTTPATVPKPPPKTPAAPDAATKPPTKLAFGAKPDASASEKVAVAVLSPTDIFAATPAKAPGKKPKAAVLTEEDLEWPESSPAEPSPEKASRVQERGSPRTPIGPPPAAGKLPQMSPLVKTGGKRPRAARELVDDDLEWPGDARPPPQTPAEPPAKAGRGLLAASPSPMGTGGRATGGKRPLAARALVEDDLDCPDAKRTAKPTSSVPPTGEQKELARACPSSADAGDVTRGVPSKKSADATSPSLPIPGTLRPLAGVTRIGGSLLTPRSARRAESRVPSGPQRQPGDSQQLFRGGPPPVKREEPGSSLGTRTGDSGQQQVRDCRFQGKAAVKQEPHPSAEFGTVPGTFGDASLLARVKPEPGTMPPIGRAASHPQIPGMPINVKQEPGCARQLARQLLPTSAASAAASGPPALSQRAEAHTVVAGVRIKSDPEAIEFPATAATAAAAGAAILDSEQLQELLRQVGGGLPAGMVKFEQ